MPTNRNRRWCFTVYPDLLLEDAKLMYDTDVINIYNRDEVDYVIMGVEECPTTFRVHYQGYVEFNKAMRLSGIKKIPELATAHLEVAAGNADQNQEYCKKDGVFYELGSPKSQGKAREADDLMKIIKDGGSMLDVLQQSTGWGWCQYNRGLQEAMTLLRPPRSADSPPTVRILWGLTGTGKTRLAHDLGAHQVWYRTPFFGGQLRSPKVVFDDFHARCMSRDVFLRITDRYPLTVEVKGGEIQWNPQQIYFTSNFNPINWVFACGLSWDDACHRRITIITECK